MRIRYKPFELRLKYPFQISGYSRLSTPIIILELEHEGIIGYGEASMVPYLGENIETAIAFLTKVDLSPLEPPFNFDEISSYIDSLAPGNPAIKAAIDIALHDLQGKIEGKPCFELFGSRQENMPETSLTIGMDTPEVVARKVEEAEHARILKVKLGSEEDKILVSTIRSITDKPLYVDANQGWKSKEEALELIFWLADMGVQLIEQPMPKMDNDSNAWITERSPLPIIADESFQRFSDFEYIRNAYHGVNIKLMKSTGMYEAFKMIARARELDLKILIGCMSETSIATQAAIALAPLCDWADIDGPFLTSNNPFKDPEFYHGKWQLSLEPGLGLKKKEQSL